MYYERRGGGILSPPSVTTEMNTPTKRADCPRRSLADGPEFNQETEGTLLGKPWSLSLEPGSSSRRSCGAPCNSDSRIRRGDAFLQILQFEGLIWLMVFTSFPFKNGEASDVLLAEKA